MLTVLVSTISSSQVFLLKNVSSFCKCKNYSHFCSKHFTVYSIFNYQSFNDTLTNDIITFEQMGPDICQGGIQCVACGNIKLINTEIVIHTYLAFRNWLCHLSILLLQTRVLVQYRNQNDKQCRSWWEVLQGVSSGFKLFVNVSLLVTTMADRYIFRPSLV